MKKLFLLFLFILLISCVSAPSPIVIYETPKADVSDDMTIEEYMRSSTDYAVRMKAFVDELINQIMFKTNYIDLRKDKKKNDRESNKN